MVKNKLYLLLAVIFTIGAWSCQKNNDLTSADIGKTANTETPSMSLLSSLPDADLSEEFSMQFEEVSDQSMTDIFAPSNHNSPEYLALAASSIAILEKADVLDSLKFHLNTTDNNDPHLVLAAKLIHDIYIQGPQAGGSNPLNDILKCALGTLSVPATAVIDALGGASLAEIGTIIHAMGTRWLAQTLLKTAAKAATGWGLTIMVAEFTYCMIFSDYDPINTDPIDWNESIIPIIPTYPVEQFTLYIQSVEEWYTIWYGPGLIYDAPSLNQAIDTFTASLPTTYEVYEFSTQPGFIAQLKDYVTNHHFSGSDGGGEEGGEDEDN